MEVPVIECRGVRTSDGLPVRVLATFKGNVVPGFAPPDNKRFAAWTAYVAIRSESAPMPHNVTLGHVGCGQVSYFEWRKANPLAVNYEVFHQIPVEECSRADAVRRFVAMIHQSVKDAGCEISTDELDGFGAP